MAFIFKEGNVTVTIQTRDHRPAHVHVDSPDASVKVDISGPVPKILPVSKKKRAKSSAAFERKALKMVGDKLELCQAAWRKYHGSL